MEQMDGLTVSYPKEKALIIVNPFAGVITSNFTQNTINNFLNKNQIQFEIYQTARETSLRDLISKKIQEGFNKFIVAGGDGTVSLAADGLVGTGFPLAVIPTGTGNLLARELHIPLSVIPALKLAFSSEAEVRALDGMKVNGKRVYLLNISIGISPELFQDEIQKEKRFVGRVTYIMHFIKLILNLNIRNLKVDIDGKKQSKWASEVFISNGKILGFPPFSWNETSALDDGIVGCHFIRAIKFTDVIKFVFSLSFAPKKLEPLVKYYEIRDRLRISCKKPLKVQADGDLIGFTPILITIEKNLCKFIVPPVSHA